MKLGLGWTGPYKIVQKLSECVHKIQNESQNKEFVVHVDHLNGCGMSIHSLGLRVSGVSSRCMASPCRVTFPCRPGMTRVPTVLSF